MSIDTGQQTIHIGESGNRGGHGSIGLSGRRGIKRESKGTFLIQSKSTASGGETPNAAEPQPKRASARTTNAPRFAVTDIILSAVHPALRARLSRPLVYVSGCYGCRTSA